MYFLLAIVSSVLLCSADDQCILQYVEQPSTILECNPYNLSTPSPTWILKTACEAMVKFVHNASYLDQFDLYWYRKSSSNSYIENLGQGIPSETQLSKRIILDNISLLNNACFSENMPGEYWCQAVAANSSGEYVLTKSNVLTISGPEDYASLNTCVGIISSNSRKCAITFGIKYSLITTSLKSFQLDMISSSLQHSEIKLYLYIWVSIYSRATANQIWNSTCTLHFA